MPKCKVDIRYNGKIIECGLSTIECDTDGDYYCKKHFKNAQFLKKVYRKSHIKILDYTIV